MHLLTSKIVPASEQAFWEPMPAEWDGGTPRKLLVLTLPYLPAGPEEITLIRMLQACQLQPEEYQMLSLEPDQKVAWHALQERFQPQYVLMLGILPEQLGISALLRLYEPNDFSGCRFLPSASLSVLEQFPEAKKQLWLNALKPVFLDGL